MFTVGWSVVGLKYCVFYSRIGCRRIKVLCLYSGSCVFTVGSVVVELKDCVLGSDWVASD